MGRLSDLITDESIAIAKRNGHPTVTSRHVLAALLGRDEVVSDIDSTLLPTIEEVLGAPGSAVTPPEMTEEATQVAAECSTIDQARIVLARLLEVDIWVALAVEAGNESNSSETSENRAERSLDDALQELDNLTGLSSVKESVASLVEIHRLNDERANRGLPTVPVGLHLVFTGNPGTGKTTVARIIADIYRGLGLLPRGHLVEVQRADLVAGYVGQTAIQVQKVVRSAMGGVLFIDEAYALTSSHGNDYGSEAVATLVKEMEDHRDEIAVIVAGYTGEMSQFIAMNAGLRSRFQRFIEFPDYPDDDLVEIFKGLASAHGIGVPNDVESSLHSFIAASPPNIRLGNGRFVRNLFEEMYARMAVRVSADGVITDEELESFEIDDVPVMEALTSYTGFGFGRATQQDS